VPARDEAAVIGETVRWLLAQDYENIELLVLDDVSTDGTGNIARQAANGDPRFRIIDGSRLPTGWIGRIGPAISSPNRLAATSWSLRRRCSLGARRADGADRLDAAPHGRHGSRLSHTDHGDLAERLVVSLLMMVIMGYLPEIAVRLAPFPSLAAATGSASRCAGRCMTPSAAIRL